MRFIPDAKYNGYPCSYVAVGCAYNEELPLPDKLKDDGYLTLDSANKYIRHYLNVRKKVYFKGSEREPLFQFLNKNTEKCIVCVYGHFIYVDNKDYWSFFDVDRREVVCVWYLKE